MPSKDVGGKAVAAPWNLCNVLHMETLYITISQGRSELCDLVDRVESGQRIVFTNHGKPKAVLSAYRANNQPWRAEKPDDPARYGDLQSPIMEEWK